MGLLTGAGKEAIPTGSSYHIRFPVFRFVQSGLASMCLSLLAGNHALLVDTGIVKWIRVRVPLNELKRKRECIYGYIGDTLGYSSGCRVYSMQRGRPLMIVETHALLLDSSYNYGIRYFKWLDLK